VSPAAQLDRTHPERGEQFACFGSRCGVWVRTDRGEVADRLTLGLAKHRLLELHRRFTRFDRHSELSLLNDDPRERIPVSATMARFVRAALDAAKITGGLVDPTLVGAIERAGYVSHLERGISLELLLELAPPRRPGAGSERRDWERIHVDEEGLTVERPVGVRLDSGGIAKGLFADLIADSLREAISYGVDCAGDLRVGTAGGVPRVIGVQSPFDERVLHHHELCEGAVATSGITNRSWLDRHGAPAHHLLDPSSGLPAFTGIVQVSALAPSAYEAEIRAKAALLSGPDGASRWLPHGGIVVYEDGAFDVL
jgi:thiamine biosynthesis lipoprotein